MAQNENRIILVFGATGAQGRSVVDYALKSGNCTIRAVVRDPTSEGTKKLRNLGVEIVQGDMSKPEEIPELAFKGVYGVFLMTNFWDPSMQGKEFELGREIVKKCATAGVKHLIFSSLPNVDEESKSKWCVPHCTDKAKLEQYIRKRKDDFDYITFVAASFYYQNFIHMFKPQKDENGQLTVMMPETKSLSAFDVTQLGGIVMECFNSPEQYNEKFIPIAKEHSNPQSFVDAISEKLGKEVKLKTIPIEDYAKLPFQGAYDIAQMFGWFDEFTAFGERDWSMGKKIDPTLRSFRQWLDDNIESFREKVGV